MKNATILLGVFLVSALIVGCDETSLPDSLKALDAAQAIGTDTVPAWDMMRLHAADGSCDGDGNQYGPAALGGENQNGAGAGDRDRDRLRDGTCLR